MTIWSIPKPWAEGTSPTSFEFLIWLDKLLPEERVVLMTQVLEICGAGNMCRAMQHGLAELGDGRLEIVQLDGIGVAHTSSARRKPENCHRAWAGKKFR